MQTQKNSLSVCNHRHCAPWNWIDDRDEVNSRTTQLYWALFVCLNGHRASIVANPISHTVNACFIINVSSRGRSRSLYHSWRDKSPDQSAALIATAPSLFVNIRHARFSFCRVWLARYTRSSLTGRSLSQGTLILMTKLLFCCLRFVPKIVGNG